MKRTLIILAALVVVCGGCKKDRDNSVTLTIHDATFQRVYDEAWSCGDTNFFADITKIDRDVIYIAGSEDYSADLPYFYGTVGATAGKIYTHDDDYMVGYFEGDRDFDADGNGNWRVLTSVQEISAIDFSAKTMSAVITQTMSNERKSIESADMELRINNARWVKRSLTQGPDR